LLPGEPDPRLPGAATESTPIPALSNPCDQPAKVLVFGDDTLSRAGLVPQLRAMGAEVTDGATLPQNLAGYDVVFHVGFRVPLTALERERLALFLEDGGAVHLTGERPCCELVNDSHTVFVRQVVAGGQNITLGRQGDVLSLFGDSFFPYAANPGAKGGITTTPNTVTQLRLVSPGGIGGITNPSNVLLTGLNGAVVGAVWDKTDLVRRGGRLTVIMDTNWLNSLSFADNLELLENMLGFMCRATPADEDQDGVIARLDCNDFDATVGNFLFEDDFSQSTGFFSPTPQLDAPWGYQDGITFAADGGQQAQLGQPRDWSDVVVFAKLSASGTKTNCGLESGQEACTSTDRWRAGVVLRAAEDADQDEGYHGYRCALSSNAVNGCFEDGLFLQIGEFMDAPEDDVDSECARAGTCPPNTTFDQLGRQNHELIDLGAGDTGYITFYAVGQNMHCEAVSDDGQVVTVTGTDDSFATGTVALSTLNIYGEFDFVRVCQALALPGQASTSVP
ncbi:MAG TPA: hypothetical protein VFG35_11680, partial [Actinoplanes sp.]|nr:hypothetical protein [Actinoplanes sp.]